jgi:hypothetical protein
MSRAALRCTAFQLWVRVDHESVFQVARRCLGERHSPPREEGRLRHQIKVAKPHQRRRRGGRSHNNLAV